MFSVGVFRGKVSSSERNNPIRRPYQSQRLRLPRSHLSLHPHPNPSPSSFDTREMRKVMDGHDLETRDGLFRLMEESSLFFSRRPRRGGGGRVVNLVAAEYDMSKEQQVESTMERAEYLFSAGVFRGWMTSSTDGGGGEDMEMRKRAINEVLGLYDHSLAIKLGVHFFLWGGAVQFLGTKRHHDKWLKETENYNVKGCFAMTELGHGSNIRGIETMATYDLNTGEFVINTPCESAQKYWIGGAANHATHAIVFSQLHINGTNEGVHAFVVQIRDANAKLCANVRVADCGHKIGLNGVDTGRIWFDNLRIPRENLLNSVADVLPDGQYVSAIENRDQRFAAFLAPLTSGRVNIAANAVYTAKLGLAIAVRYALTRRAFSVKPNGPEVLLLDYPSYQWRLLPLLAKTCAMSCAINFLKRTYIKRTPETNKAIHVYSSVLKAATTWHNMITLQECREACGGQGLKTENRIGILKGEFDAQCTFEGDNNVLMQRVGKVLLAEYAALQKKKKKKKKKAFDGLGLEHMNGPCPVVPANLTSSTLRSSKFQVDMFCLRERDLLHRFAAEVSNYRAQGEDEENAILLSHQLAQELARAFTERTILQSIVEAETSSSTADSLREVLGLLRSMYALVCIEEDASFLRYGYLSVANSASARKEVVKLCGDLRPHALAVVSSFGIPDSFLSPIAFDWIEANSWGAC